MIIREKIEKLLYENNSNSLSKWYCFKSIREIPLFRMFEFAILMINLEIEKLTYKIRYYLQDCFIIKKQINQNNKKEKLIEKRKNILLKYFKGNK